LKNLKVCVCLFVTILCVTIIAACGGSSALPQPKPAVSLSAAQVFSTSMVGQTWTFRNGYGDTTTIEVQPGEAPNSVIWHYIKDNARAYWTPGADGAELWFELDLDPANANGWYNTTAHIIFRGQCQWSWCTGPQDFTYVNETTPGKPRPYLIIPPTGNDLSRTRLDTTFLDFGNPDTRWRTDAYVEEVGTPVYSGPALVSEQWEGPCTHEKWYFAPGKGLVKVVDLDEGDCQGLPDGLTMVRVQ
jgi:hypothetical protein